MAEKKYTTKELLDMLKSYHIDSDEESIFGSHEDTDYSSESEMLPSEDDTATSEEEAATQLEHMGEGSSRNVNISGATWSMNIVKTEKLAFTGKCGLQTELLANITPIELFEHFFDRDIIMLMVSETNRYAQQYISRQQLSQHARMKKWKEVTEDDMRKFIGIILLTGLIKLPRLEDYWKKDPLFFHPLFHHIQMSYNRFALILKNWHFCDNEEATADRLYKISRIMDMVFSNIQKLYIPGAEVSIDETTISHNGYLHFRQCNTSDRHRHRIKIYKLCDMSGYVWNASVYCGGGSSKNKIPGLSYSGSVVIGLGELLLSCGRLFAADSWYSSVELASYLKARNTEYCGVIRKNRKKFPRILKTMKMKKGEMKSISNFEGIRIFKYQDSKEIFMISTFHGNELKTVTKLKHSGDTALKPSVIVDYNRVKGGADLSNQMTEFCSPARKSIKWYKKVVFQLLNIGVFNSWIIYNKISKSYTLADFTKAISSCLLGNFNTSVRQNLSHFLGGVHKLTNIPRRESGKIARKRCVSCYENIANSENVQEARKKAKRVSTECQRCSKAYCLNCFNFKHKS